MWVTCWQLWPQLGRSWTFQWRTPCKWKDMVMGSECTLLLDLHIDVTTTGGEIKLTPAAGSSRSSIHCFLLHLHNKYLLCKHWPSVEKPCQLLSDLRVPFREGNAGHDSLNWFLSLQTHLSNLFPFLTPSPSLCGSMTTQHCEVALLNLCSDAGIVLI